MPVSPVQKALAGMLVACGCLTCAPLSAESLGELDALSDASTDEATGIASAQEQAARGEYLDALATLERVLAVHPRSREALLNHALYLCKIDDRQGGLVEIGKLQSTHFGQDTLSQARATCGRSSED